MLFYMAQHPRKVLTHRAILNAVWGGASVEQNEYLRVFVGQLRKKLEPRPAPQSTFSPNHGWDIDSSRATKEFRRLLISRATLLGRQGQLDAFDPEALRNFGRPLGRPSFLANC